MHKLRVVSIGSSLVALLAAPLAHAEEGEFQLGLATPFLVYQSVTNETDPEDTDVSTTTWGITHEVLGEIGYGITPSLIVGGLFKLGGTSSSTEVDGEDSDSSTFSLLLGPKLDYVISPGDKVQPFVGGVIGYLSSSTSTSFGDIDNKSSQSGFEFMARGGVRIFPGKEFSIDPWLGLSYFTGSNEDEGDDGNSVDTDVSRLRLGVFLGLSGWL